MNRVTGNREQKTRAHGGFIAIFAIMTVVAVLSSCDDPMKENSNGGTNGTDSDGNGSNGTGGTKKPALELTAELVFPEITTLGTTRDDWQGEGAAQTWTLSAGEETVAYFAVTKGAGQSLSVGGTGAAKVAAIDVGGLPVGVDTSGLDGNTVLYKVDTEELLFDGNLSAGGDSVGPLAFTLTAAEEGKSSIVYTVNLNLSLDATDVSLWRKENGRWVKIRDAAITRDQATTCRALTEGPVEDLENAFAWVTAKAEGGDGTGAEPGTTTGYAEYRVFLKAAEHPIGKINLIYQKNYVSLELYGAGSPGTAERRITMNTALTTSRATETVNYNTELNDQGGFIAGLINVFPVNGTDYDRWQILVLGKNVTLDGGGEDNAVGWTGTSTQDTPWPKMGVAHLIGIALNGTVIMRDHAKITGYYSENAVSSCSVIYLTAHLNYLPTFYMQGGAITGNTVDKDYGGVAYLANSSGTFLKTGGTVSDNYGYDNGSPVPRNVVRSGSGYAISHDFDDGE
ncbi:MAG: hypothetical protein LBU00_03125 [Treponema sp.]|jgi:hypothetical protein|nr:hypothetical protein [Treponema sp.]